MSETLNRKINIAVISQRVQRVQRVQRLPPAQRPSSVAQLISFLATITSSCQHRTPFCLQCKEVQSSLVQCSVVQRSTVQFSAVLCCVVQCNIVWPRCRPESLPGHHQLAFPGPNIYICYPIGRSAKILDRSDKRSKNYPGAVHNVLFCTPHHSNWRSGRYWNEHSCPF